MSKEIAYMQSNGASLIVPDGIESIVASFNELSLVKTLEEVSLPSSLVKINACFEGCTKLKKIVFRAGIHPNLSIGKDSFKSMFNVNTAEQLLDLDAPDIIKLHIFKEHFHENEKIDLHMKRAILFAYLNGRSVSDKFEEAIIRYAKKDFNNLLLYFCRCNDTEMFAKLLGLFKPNKQTFELLTRSLETAQQYQAIPIATMLSDYLQQNSKPGETKKITDDAKLKQLGLKDLSLADWKRRFRLNETPFGFIIKKYVGTDTSVEVPEFIGDKPVVAFEEGAFRDSSVSTIESPVSPYLSDFFGWTTFPTLTVYGHTALLKKARVKDLKAAVADDLVLFGSYPADSTDNRRQPIVWRVVNIDGDTATLISRNRIEVLPMHSEKEPVTWETCDLRKWLNELFYPFAFTDQEKQKILKVKIPNPPNPEYKTSSGNDTEDHVYLPGVDEAGKYGALIHRGGKWDILEYRGYNAEQEWYRTNGRYSTYFATYVSKLDKYNGLGCDELAGVRPMIQVKISD